MAQTIISSCVFLVTFFIILLITSRSGEDRVSSILVDNEKRIPGPSVIK